MTEPKWLLKTAILAVHNQLIAEFGGAEGIRDEGLLDSALSRPVNTFNYGGNVSLPFLAATYASGIIQNHPFVDGNKRTGFLAAYMFLGRNGVQLVADEISATVMTLSLAAGEISEDEYAMWLGQNTSVWKDDS